MEKIWGGTKLLKTYSLEEKYNNIGEVWLLSAVKDHESKVANGFLAGNNLSELSEIYMGDLLGDAVFDKFGHDFPLLFKILDTSDWLSVQVHPDDILAKKKHNLLNGKTEMWYVMEGGEKAEIISGFNTITDRIKVQNTIQNNTLQELLQSYKTQKGDLFFTPSGMVHAIGPDVTLAEIQQSSDVTYRLWDWDRTDANGKKRDLHIEAALDALKYEFEKGGKLEYPIPKNGSSNMVSESQFTTNLIQLDKNMLLEKDIFPIDSFIAYLCTEGSANIRSSSTSDSLVKGELILIPAVMDEIQIVAAESCTILETYII
ncbi:MAG: class I mannose-6-phosphate isomerase [Bacteroidales bacterium]|nr:class I mannose-6-phosphate isomerase [Bacteroidales bacterium]